MEAVSGRREGVGISVSVNGGTIQIRVGSGAEAATADVLLVGYLREATTPIGRGENAGRTLKESNIVLSLYELGVQFRSSSSRGSYLARSISPIPTMTQ